jgi:hypothetical protein
MSQQPTNLPNFDGLAQLYASAVAQRRGLTEALRERVLDLYREFAPELRTALHSENAMREELVAAVEQHPNAFERPRTRQAHGVKFGWQKGKDKIEVPDEPKTIRLIRERLPEEQAELLIKIKETVHKPGLLDLTARDLKRLAVRQIPGEDSPLVKAIEDGVDKLVGALQAELDVALDDQHREGA